MKGETRELKIIYNLNISITLRAEGRERFRNFRPAQTPLALEERKLDTLETVLISV